MGKEKKNNMYLPLTHARIKHKKNIQNSIKGNINFPIMVMDNSKKNNCNGNVYIKLPNKIILELFVRVKT